MTRFHLREGYYFTRLEDGGVIIQSGSDNSCLTVSANEWASVVASMSKEGETTETYNEALRKQVGD
jgi:hypothetical protein